MKALLFIVLSVLFALALAKSVDFTICMDNPAFVTNQVDVTPDEIHFGDQVTAKITGAAKLDMSGGTLHSTIFFKNTKMFEYNYDICTVSDTGCPITPGPWSGTVVQKTPAIGFTGNYTTRSQSYGPDGALLACVEFTSFISRK